jgi:hypothetical protein
MTVRAPSRSLKPARAFALAALTSLLLASSGFAVPLYYEVASATVSADTVEPGLVIGSMVKPTVPGTGFTLSDSGSFTFSLFDIWTDQTKISADDLISSPISATISFTNPLTGAIVNGITVGGSWMKGLSQWGILTWSGPVTIVIPGDRTFQVSLSDATFNYGFGGLQEGMMCGATVNATVTQTASFFQQGGQPVPPGSPVPEGGKTAFLLGSTLVALRFIARNKRAKN